MRTPSARGGFGGIGSGGSDRERPTRPRPSLPTDVPSPPTAGHSIMLRIPTPPRADWTKTVESQGLLFHSIDGVPYWDEAAYYLFEAAEIDAIEAATYRLNEMCLEAVGRVIEKRRLGEFDIPEPYHDWVRLELGARRAHDLRPVRPLLRRGRSARSSWSTTPTRPRHCWKRRSSSGSGSRTCGFGRDRSGRTGRSARSTSSTACTSG